MNRSRSVGRIAEQECELRHWLSAPHRRARWVTVTGGKGGVGKTNIAVGLALTAASFGRRTVLVDGDLGLANVDVILDFEPEWDLSDVVSGRALLNDALTEVPFGLQVLPGASGLLHMTNMDSNERSRLSAVLEELGRRFELIIVDTGAGISQSILDFCIMGDEALVVTTPEPTAITDTFAVIKAMSRQSVELKIWLLVNMATSRGQAEDTARHICRLAKKHLEIDLRSAGFVVDDPEVRAAVREREAFALYSPQSRPAYCVREIGRTLGFEHDCERVGRDALSTIAGRLFPPTARSVDIGHERAGGL